MPARFDFISPGILLNEIDESKIPETVNDELGPVIVGRSLTGPAMKPVRVKNLEDFNTIFGKGISGKGTQDNDVWRKGNLVGPTYAVYAAQAHLASETTPVTFVRLLGEASTDASTDAQLAGWNIADAGNPSATVADNKSAYGLFIIQSGALGQLGTAAQTTPKTGSLAAIFYVNGGGVALSGVVGPQGNPIVQSTASTGVLVNSLGATANTFKLNVYNAAGAISDTITFDFTQGSKNYIRDVFNTNPQLLQANTNFGLTDKTYFLGETFEESGIKIDQFDVIAGPINDSWLTMWLAEVPWGTPITISVNPTTGKLEHDGYKWLERDEMINDCYPYLQSFVKWAFNSI